MAYKCHEFCNGQVLDAEALNEMEQAIVDLEKMATITGKGAPTSATEGAIGCFYMDTTSETKDVYKCTAVTDGVYTWEQLGGTSESPSAMIVTFDDSAEENQLSHSYEEIAKHITSGGLTLLCNPNLPAYYAFGGYLVSDSIYFVRTTGNNNTPRHIVAIHNDGTVESMLENGGGSDVDIGKNIIDKCLPSFSESGSVVTCEPVEGYPLHVVSSISPAQEGSGDPSPENVRPISGHTEVKLTQGGKNLFDVNAVPSHVYVINNGDGTLTVEEGISGGVGSDSKTLRMIAPGLKVGKTYTLSATSTGSNKYIYLRGYNNSWYFGGRLTMTDAILDSYIRWYMDTNTTGTISNIQIEEGTVATSYEPYRSETFTIDLGQSVYGGSLDWQTGVLTITKSMIRLTSDMPWVMTGLSNPNGIISFYVNKDMPDIKDTRGESITVLSSHYKYYPDGWSVNSVSYPYAIKILTPRRIYLTDARFADLESFKAFLDAENVQLVYFLKKPITIQLTPQEVLALSGANTIYSDTVDTTVSGKADPSAVIEKLTNAIIALGGNV